MMDWTTENLEANARETRAFEKEHAEEIERAWTTDARRGYGNGTPYPDGPAWENPRSEYRTVLSKA